MVALSIHPSKTPCDVLWGMVAPKLALDRTIIPVTIDYSEKVFCYCTMGDFMNIYEFVRGWAIVQKTIGFCICIFPANETMQTVGIYMLLTSFYILWASFAIKEN